MERSRVAQARLARVRVAGSPAPPPPRTIIVGDVHGCAEELTTLLSEISFSSGDTLVFVGDLIARGPDSLGVLDIARQSGSVIVRGNHEQRLLDWKHFGERIPLGRMHREIAEALRPIDWKLLESSTLLLDLPEHGVSVVHAGVDPHFALDAQPKEALLNIRTVVQKQGAHSSRVLWGSAYNGPTQIVFGHNAAPGLQLHPFATGLDTGCVYGGRLTAMVLPEGAKVPRLIHERERALVSVPARRVHFNPLGKPSAVKKSSRGRRA